jgi:hypothetical protein
MGPRDPHVDPACPVCAQAVPSRRVFEQGEVLHAWCRARQLEFMSLEARARAADLIGHAERLQVDARGLRRKVAPCPLCGRPATLRDWRPRVDWIVVEGCPCDGFFLRGSLFDARLPSLSPADRGTLARRVRQFRAMRQEAWCTTTDGTTGGMLVAQTARLQLET